MNKTSKGFFFKQKNKKKITSSWKKVTLQDCLQALLLSLFIVKFYE